MVSSGSFAWIHSGWGSYQVQEQGDHNDLEHLLPPRGVHGSHIERGVPREKNVQENIARGAEDDAPRRSAASRRSLQASECREEKLLNK